MNLRMRASWINKEISPQAEQRACPKPLLEDGIYQFKDPLEAQGAEAERGGGTLRRGGELGRGLRAP